MIASLDLVRSPLGLAQLDLLRLARRRPREASFGAILLPVRLQLVPLPLPHLGSFGFFGIWPDPAALARFRDVTLPGRRSSERLELDLRPLQGFGSWRGESPLAGERADPGGAPVLLVTHSRTRPQSLARFLFADRPVVAALARAPGHLWAQGFADDLRRADTGTLSLWRSAEDAARFAYSPGVHQQAVEAQKQGGWFSESWFGRFAVEDARGSWRGLRVDLPEA